MLAALLVAVPGAAANPYVVARLSALPSAPTKPAAADRDGRAHGKNQADAHDPAAEVDETRGRQPGSHTPGALNGQHPRYAAADLLDIVNPLQHIPIVAGVYQHATGDEMKAPAAVAGGLLYGGVPGFLGGIVNAVIEDASGRDIAGLAMNEMNESPRTPRLLGPRRAFQTPHSGPRKAIPAGEASTDLALRPVADVMAHAPSGVASCPCGGEAWSNRRPAGKGMAQRPRGEPKSSDGLDGVRYLASSVVAQPGTMTRATAFLAER